MAPLVSETIADSLFQCLDSTEGAAERHDYQYKERVQYHLGFKPSQRSDVLSPKVDMVLAAFASFAVTRDRALMADPEAVVPRQ